MVMSEEVTENAPIQVLPEKNLIEKSQKQSKPSQKKNTPQKIDFLKWLDSLQAGVNHEKLVGEIPQLNKNYQDLATELLEAKSNIKSKPSSKLKFEKFPLDFIFWLSQKIDNPYVLIQLLTSVALDIDYKMMVLDRLKKVEVNEDVIEYLLKKTESIKNLVQKESLWNITLTNGILTTTEWNKIQFRYLNLGISQGLSLTMPIQMIMGLRLASEQFYSLETSQRNKVLKKLIETDLLTFLVFLIHVSNESYSAKFIDEIIDKRKLNVLLAFFENRQFLSGPWLEIFEKNFIAPLLKSSLDAIMQFDILLPFIPLQSQFSHLVSSDTLPRAVARSFRRNDELSKLLADTRVDVLESRVEDLMAEIAKIAAESEHAKSRNLDNEKRIRDFELAIENYENRLRSQMKTENVGSEAFSQSVRADLLKVLVENFDHLFQGADGYQLERAFQKAGVSRLGTPNAEFSWDPETCETLTGDSFESGLVVRSGYTWLNAGKKVVIRRVLLKSK